MKDPTLDRVLLVVQSMQEHIKDLEKKLEEQQQFSKQHRSDLVKLQQKVNELERKAIKPTPVSRF